MNHPDGRINNGAIKRFGETMPARFVDGTISLIKAFLNPRETRAGFIRAAVNAEIARRAAERGRK